MVSSGDSFGSEFSDFLGINRKKSPIEEFVSGEVGENVKQIDALDPNDPQEAFLKIANILRIMGRDNGTILDAMLHAVVQVAACSIGATRENQKALRPKVGPLCDQAYETMADAMIEFAKQAMPLFEEANKKQGKEEKQE